MYFTIADTLCKKLKKAQEGLAKTVPTLIQLSEEAGVEKVKEWTKMAEKAEEVKGDARTRAEARKIYSADVMEGKAM